MNVFRKITLIFLLTLAAPVLLLLPACAEADKADVRPPAVAGRFYPGSADDLAKMIQYLEAKAAPSIRQAALDLPTRRPLKALIMPHAGYVYSGYTAVHAGLASARRSGDQKIKKVIILGPDHHAGITGCAISAARAYQTPLANVLLHPDAHRLLGQSDLFSAAPEISEQQEHSVEVILPFLQTWLKDFQIVPIVVGRVDPAALAAAIAPLVDDTTLIVVSSDLSHYLPYDQARKTDQQTIGLILKGKADQVAAGENIACGKLPISALMLLAAEQNWTPRLINYTNSGDTAGNHDKVVGYSTIAFYGGLEMASKKITKKQGQALVQLARKTIFERLGITAEDPAIDIAKEKVLQEKAGTFVTLTMDGELRGCIGSLSAEEPIAISVRRNALNAAFHDPRFSPLSSEEAGTVNVEVSVLSDPEPLEYKNAQDLLAKLNPNADGVIIQKGLARATFLPQVWHQLPEKEVFLAHLCNKAGLPENCWEEGGLKVYTYQVQYFESKN